MPRVTFLAEWSQRPDLLVHTSRMTPLPLSPTSLRIFSFCTMSWAIPSTAAPGPPPYHLDAESTCILVSCLAASNSSQLWVTRERVEVRQAGSEGRREPGMDPMRIRQLLGGGGGHRGRSCWTLAWTPLLESLFSGFWSLLVIPRQGRTVPSVSLGSRACSLQREGVTPPLKEFPHLPVDWTWCSGRGLSPAQSHIPASTLHPGSTLFQPPITSNSACPSRTHFSLRFSLVH